MLPFGLRSAPKIFTAIADALTWHLHQAGIPDVDPLPGRFYHPRPPPPSPSLPRIPAQATNGLLGVPHKTEGPTTCLTFLGIETAAQSQLTSSNASSSSWATKTSCLRKELIGLLNHACKVVRSFLRRMLNLLHSNPHSSEQQHGGWPLWRPGTGPPSCTLPTTCPMSQWHPGHGDAEHGTNSHGSR